MDCFYCAKCADKLGRRPPMPTLDPLGSTYQRDKHEKHIKPSSSYCVQTVFDNSSTQYYEECIREVFENGAVQIENRGTNIIFCPSTQSTLGSKYKWGEYASRENTVIVVKTSEPHGVHAFLTASSQYENHQCAQCGNPVL
jgi:hypothetical protein